MSKGPQQSEEVDTNTQTNKQTDQQHEEGIKLMRDSFELIKSEMPTTCYLFVLNIKGTQADVCEASPDRLHVNIPALPREEERAEAENF